MKISEEIRTREEDGKDTFYSKEYFDNIFILVEKAVKEIEFAHHIVHANFASTMTQDGRRGVQALNSLRTALGTLKSI